MKKVLLLLCLLLIAFALTACGGEKAPEASSTLSMPLNELVSGKIADAEKLMDMPLTDLEDYLGIDPSLYTDAVYLLEGDLTGREVLVVRAVDQDAAKTVAACLENYREQRLHETQNYLPDVYTMLKDTAVQQKNNTVALIMLENGPKLSTALLAGE